MGSIIREVDHGTRVVADIQVRVTELIWHDGARSFEVHRVDSGEDLTENDCFDQTPTDEQIANLLEQQEPADWWICRGCGARFDAAWQGDLIVDHVRDCDRVDGAGNPIGGTP